MTAKRVLHLIMLIPLFGTLLSCDVFFASRQGRWNSQDPNAEIELYNRVLHPTEDTWVESPSMNNHTSSELKVWNSKYTLLKFDIPTLPDVITVAELQLYCTSDGMGVVSLHRILKHWNADNLDPAAVLPSDFFDSKPQAEAHIGDTSGQYYSWDVKDTVGSLTYGILLMDTEGKESRFNSVEVAGGEPMLIIEGYNEL
jgi:hypothetical protein